MAQTNGLTTYTAKYQASRPVQTLSHALAVLVSRVTDRYLLDRFNKQPGTYTQFASQPFLGDDPEAALRAFILPKLALRADSKVQALGCVYVPELSRRVHLFQLVPLDYMQAIINTGLSNKTRGHIFRRYFTEDGHHSAQALAQTKTEVRLLAREYEALRPD